MIRTLAEFVMRGRFQAVGIALIGVCFPLLYLLTPAVIGLVTLRKGWQEGTLIAVFAVVAAAAMAINYEAGALAAYESVGAIFVATLTAQVLRSTAYWPAVLTAIVALSTLAALLAGFAVDDPTSDIRELHRLLIEAGSTEFAALIEQVFAGFSAAAVVGSVAMSIAMYALLGLLLARWAQATLFNPGGLRQELHRLRLPPAVVIVCAIAIVICHLRGDGYIAWKMLVALPLIVSGLCLCHCAVAKYRWGIGPLILLYIFPPFWSIALVLGLSDVWVDYRRRFNLM